MEFSDEEQNMPYDELARELFDEPKQQWIPFLGAGVSISGATSESDAEPPAPPVDPRVSLALAAFDSNTDAEGNPLPAFSAGTKLFLQLAVGLALKLEKSGQSENTLKRLLAQPYPPSAGDLTEIFRAGLPPFEDVAAKLNSKLGREEKLRSEIVELLRPLGSLAGVSSPPLSGMSAYYELLNSRDQVLSQLMKVLANKTQVTKTHQLVARMAARHLRSGQGNYLVITTNYDTLMERAIEERDASLPYVVLWMSKKDFRIRARFGNLSEPLRMRYEACNPARAANKFTFVHPPPESDAPTPSNPRFLMIYKIHGCIQQVLECPRFAEALGIEESESDCFHDSIVLSDQDYIASIAQLAHNDGVIPACVCETMRRVRILFLGYSLSDWNVRGFLKALRDKGAGDPKRPDYTVVRDLRTFTRGLFEKSNIVMLKTNLNAFAGALDSRADKYDR